VVLKSLIFNLSQKGFAYMNGQNEMDWSYDDLWSYFKWVEKKQDFWCILQCRLKDSM